MATYSIVRTTADGYNLHLIGPDTDVSELTKALIHFIASRRCQQMWQYEDITRTIWSIHSAEQIDNFLSYIVRVFEQSLPHARLSERWSQLALQLALSCSSRYGLKLIFIVFPLSLLLLYQTFTQFRLFWGYSRGKKALCK